MFPKLRIMVLKAVWESKIVVFILLGIGWSGYTSVSQKTCFYRNIAKGKKGPRVECLIKMKIKNTLKKAFIFGPMVIFLSWNSSAFHKFCFLWCRGTSRRLDLVNANATTHPPPNNWIQFISKASRADKFAWLCCISLFRDLITFVDLIILLSRLRLLCLETSWKHRQIWKIRKEIWWRGDVDT